jgi:hypothetical protein
MTHPSFAELLEHNPHERDKPYRSVTSAPEHGVTMDGYSRGTTIGMQPTLVRSALP